MRRSTRQTQSLNRFAAPRARLACTAIDPKLMLITACPPRSAHVIADGRTASLDRTAQDRDDGIEEAERIESGGDTKPEKTGFAHIVLALTLYFFV